MHPARARREDLRRFEREVQLSSKLTRPNTISVYDFGRTEEGSLVGRDEPPRNHGVLVQALALSTLTWMFRPTPQESVSAPGSRGCCAAARQPGLPKVRA